MLVFLLVQMMIYVYSFIYLMVLTVFVYVDDDSECWIQARIDMGDIK